jgi:hypothetical protein
MSELIAAIADIKDPSRSARARAGSSLVLLDSLHRDRRRKRRTENLVNSWPIGVGILIALAAPVMCEFLTVIKPWGMWLVFPFVELVARPELDLGGGFNRLAPEVMLFLQFPLEGLMAKKFLKDRVTVSGVVGQVILYHFLGMMQLWFVWRALGDAGIYPR